MNSSASSSPESGIVNVAIALPTRNIPLRVAHIFLHWLLTFDGFDMYGSIILSEKMGALQRAFRQQSARGRLRVMCYVLCVPHVSPFFSSWSCCGCSRTRAGPLSEDLQNGTYYSTFHP